MKNQSKQIKTIDKYINQFPDDIRSKLEAIRITIQKATPKAKEVISYGMPAFKLNKVLVYFAAYENHIGFYPTATPIKVFEKELENYETSKGAIKFRLDKKIPLSLIAKITKFRVNEDLKNK
jgi:uncharacterized protein YdhG (YjbR/CyaY superfamily)